MLRRRIITLDIVTEDGKPELWDWQALLGDGPGTTEVSVVNVIEEKVQ